MGSISHSGLIITPGQEANAFLFDLLKIIGLNVLFCLDEAILMYPYIVFLELSEEFPNDSETCSN